MSERCEVCGANLQLVGRVHRCVANTNDVANTAAASVANSTYRYRDPEKRRGYMRGYMAQRRNSSVS